MITRDKEILSGHKQLQLFEQLIAQKTIVSLAVMGTDYEQLTIITGLEQNANGGHLVIDTPSGFRKAVSGFDPWKLHFNCNGPDKVEYLFTTLGGAVGQQGLRVPLPKGVERLQRRRDFRVACLPRTALQFSAKKVNGIMVLKDVSMGGVFGDLVKHDGEHTKGTLLKESQRLIHIVIAFPAYGGNPVRMVKVRKAKVVRAHRKIDLHIDQYALQFLEIEPDQEAILRQAIYQLQRFYLQNR